MIFSADKAEFRRVDGAHRDAPGDHRLAGEPRRGPPAHADQPRHPAARAGADQLRRGRAGAARGRPGPPGLRQAVPGDGVRSPAARPCSAGAGRARPSSRRSGPSTSWRWSGRPLVGDRSTRPTASASSAAAGRRPTPPPWTPAPSLSGTTGPVLDPVFSLRRRVRVEAGTSVRVAFTTAVADSREEALALADQYHDFQRRRPAPSSWPGRTARSSCATCT